MASIKEFRLIAYLIIFLSALSLSACHLFESGDDGPGSISITSPSHDAVVSGIIQVSGRCSLIDDLVVVIDNDSHTRKFVDCNRGNWQAEFDTSYFQDSAHALVAYKDNLSDEILITTENGNLSGFTLTVPVSLGSVYDEIGPYTPLYVYAKKPATGLISGVLFDESGFFPDDFEIPNQLNGVYEIGAFLDRNNNRVMDVGYDFAGTADAYVEISNGDDTSGNVVLELYTGTSTDPDNGIFNPGNVTGSISISEPQDDDIVSGVLQASGTSDGTIDNVQVSIDDNQLSAQIVSVDVLGDWNAEFDTTRLQDGRHYLTARANSVIKQTVYFDSMNDNLQGYDVSVTVELSPGLYAEVDVSHPLYVYVEDTVSGARQIAKHESGDFTVDNTFIIGNVPNNTYQVGAFYDNNNNGLPDAGDYTGTADDLLNVWYADASSDVVLHGNEVHIESPLWGAEIRSNLIDLTGSYLGNAEEIIVSMRLTQVTYQEVEQIANLNAGAWNATLDITDVTQEGTRWLNVSAKYGARYEWDSIQVIIDRDFPRGIDIQIPLDRDTIQTSSFSTSGNYDGEPDTVTLYLDRGEASEISVVATLNNSAWSASFIDLSGVQTGQVLHTLTALADYGGGILKEDEIEIYIDPIAARSITINLPTEGETVSTDSLSVEGTHEGNPDSITVTFETGNTPLEQVISMPSASSWNVEFADISSVINGERLITALADYGAGDTEVDTVTVTVDRPVTAIPLTITYYGYPDYPYYGEGCGEYFIITDSNELNLQGGLCPIPAPASDDHALLMSLLNSDEEVDFDAVPSWTLVSRSDDGNPVNESESVSFILQRPGDGDYYQITLDFDVWSGLGGGLQYQIDTLEGWNCGGNPANCP